MNIIQDFMTSVQKLGSHDLEEAKPDAYRILLCQLVDKVLSDPGSRQCSVSEQDVAVTLVSHCVDTRPQLFCLPANDDHFKVDGEDKVADASERVKCQAMCCWLCIKLATVLAKADAAALHGKCLEAVVKLLRVLKLRDMLAYIAVVRQHVQLLADLARCYADKDPSRCACHFSFGNLVLGPSAVAVDLPAYELRYTPLVIGNLPMVAVLQANLSRIIRDVVHSAGQFLDAHTTVALWRTLYDQLDSDDLLLKSAALSTLHEVIESQGLPRSMQSSCRLVACLLDLLRSSPETLLGRQSKSTELSTTVSEPAARQLSQDLCDLMSCSRFRREVLALPASWAVRTRLMNGLRDVLAFVRDQNSVHAACLDLLICMTASEDTDGLHEKAANDELVVTLLNNGMVGPANFLLIASYICKSAAADTESCTGQVNAAGVLTDQAERSSCDTNLFILPAWATRLTSLLITQLDNAERSSWSEQEWASFLETIVVILEAQCRLVSACLTRLSSDCDSSGVNTALWIPNELLGKTASLAKIAFRNSMVSCMSRGVQLMARLAEQLILFAECNAGSGSAGSLLRDSLMEYVAFASLPWMSLHENHFDLKLSEGFSEIFKTRETLASTPIDSVARTACIAALAAFPADVAPVWRSSVIKAAASGNDLDLSIAIASSLPVLAYRVGSAAAGTAQELLKRSIGSADNSNFQLAIELAVSFGFVACCGSGTARLSTSPSMTISRRDCSILRARRVSGSQHSTSSSAVPFGSTPATDRKLDVVPASSDPMSSCIPLLCIRCSVCRNGTRQMSSTIPAGSLDLSFFAAFFGLVRLDCRSTKQHFIGSIRRVLCHIKASVGSVKRTVDIPSSTAPFFDGLLACILPLLTDGERDVRLNASHLISVVVQLSNSDSTKQDLVRQLRKLFDTADTTVRVTILSTMGKLGALSGVHDVEEFALAGLLDGLLSSATGKGSVATVAATAYTELRRMAAAKNLKPRDFFLQRQSSISKNIVELLQQETCKLQAGDAPACVSRMLGEVAKVFDYGDTKALLSVMQPYLVPPLVYSANAVSDGITRALAAEAGIPRKKLLVNQLQHVFSYIVQRWSPHDRATAIGKGTGSLEDLLIDKLGYVEREAEIDHSSLLRLRFQNIHNELLLHLSTHYQQVLRGIAYLVPYDVRAQLPGNTFTSEQLATYLESRLLGVLAHFDSLLLSSTVPVEEKHTALSSLVSIMQFMGPKRITAVRMKVMTTLKLGLQFKSDSFSELCCRAWSCFVRSVEPVALGPMLPQVVVTLMPLLKSVPTQVAAIMKYLVVDCRDQLRDYLGDLHFLPDLPELAELAVSLRTHKAFSGYNGDEQSLRSVLEQSLKSVQHENADVRSHALMHLKRLLRKNQSKLYNLVISSETADPLIVQLVQVLLTSCSRCADVATRSACGECLGEMGAIDPGRLEFRPNNLRRDMAKFLSSINEENFAFDLINELVQAFLSAEDTYEQDCVALAIQEALTKYNVRKTSDCKLWNRLSEEVREIATPYLDSKYILSNLKNWSNLPTPIYLSNKGTNFKDWVCNWSVYLSFKVLDPDASQVFRFCMAAMNCRDLSLALYLLPHIVVHVLLSRNEADTRKVQEEMMEVLRHAESSIRPSEFCHFSVQTVFSVLDHLRQWRTHRLPCDKRVDDPATDDISKIDDFLNNIPKDLLSRVSFNCGIYTRALLHLEQHMTATHQNVQDHLDYLLSIYARLDEPDAVSGVNAVRLHQASLSQQILTHECTGQLREAAACYERAIQADMRQLELHAGLIKCLSGLSQWSTALTHVTGLIADEPSWEHELNSYRVEAAWKLGDWNRLQAFLQTNADTASPPTTWDIGLGKLLLYARRKDAQAFAAQVQSLRSEQMGPLSAASMESGSFQRGYDFIVRLHMLAEAEHACNALLFRNDPLSKNELTSFLTQWDSRLSLAQESFRVLEPILTLRRTLLGLVLDGNASQCFGLSKGAANGQTATVENLVKQQIGMCWLQSARVACRAGQMQTAYSFLLNAHSYRLPETFVEQATWLWQKGDRDQAQICLEKGIKEFYPATQSSASAASVTVPARSAKLQHAKALLLFARYNEENSSVDSNTIIRQYKEVIEVCSDWEDGYFFLAKYYDKVMLNMAGGEKPQQQGQITAYSVQNFGTSLHYGSRYIYQSLPRALSLWLEFGASVQQSETAMSTLSVDERKRAAAAAVLTAHRSTLAQLNSIVATMAEKLSAYQWLTALPQLVSRICHSHPDVSVHLQAIIAKLIVEFPQQTMWNMMAVSKSSYQIRMQRCQSIFEKARCLRPDLKSFFHDATKLCDRLLDLCNKPVEQSVPVLSLSQDFRLLKRLTDDPNFSRILLPLQAAMTVVLPTSDMQEPNKAHNAFPGRQAYLRGFDETVEVLSSLQRPKKLTMLGDDGQFYPFLCKPKDDLRKDARLMDFNSVVNKLLRRDAECRRRELHIRTYMVTPLNEECGLLEWVPYTTSYRHIMMKLYRERGCYVSLRQAQQAYNFDKNSPVSTRMPAFRKLLEKHPPVFGEWFLRTFPDPTTWYAARVSYAHTLAVMSIVGYILGLGDRHGENILFDATSGHVVHVDFNCLFNKGETFDWPEVVPFRLTANMVEAMGPLGYEGVFRRACEVTLRVMREEIDPLMSVLKPFIYDPLVEWSKPQRKNGSSNFAVAGESSGEINNEKALVHVTNIEDRLKGVLKSKLKAAQPGLPLSIEGQVKRLIQEATSEENLCLMYFGWAAYM